MQHMCNWCLLLWAVSDISSYVFARLYLSTYLVVNWLFIALQYSDPMVAQLNGRQSIGIGPPYLTSDSLARQLIGLMRGKGINWRRPLSGAATLDLPLLLSSWPYVTSPDCPHTTAGGGKGAELVLSRLRYGHLPPHSHSRWSHLLGSGNLILSRWCALCFI